MNWVRGLRLSLALQGAAVVLPIVVAVAVSVDELVDRLTGSCKFDYSCSRVGPLLVMEAALLFGGPAWWAISGASRAHLLRKRQLAWLLAVNCYLVVVGLVLWTQALDHATQEAPLSEALSLAMASALVSTALLSSLVCVGRIVQLPSSTTPPFYD